MKQKVQWTERDDVFLQGCFFLAEADLCTLLLSTYILWLSKKACSAQIAVGELRSGKETGTFLYSEILYSEKQKCHIPIQPAVLLTAVETKQTPYFIAGYAGTIHLSSCFFSPESPVFGGVKIMPIKAMTGTLAALVLIPDHHGCMRGDLCFCFVLLD